MNDRVVVIAPVEERFGPLGGAVARWISSTYPQSRHQVDVLAANARRQQDFFASARPCESRTGAALARLIFLAQRPAGLVGLDGPRLVRAMTWKGKLWLRLSRGSLRGATSIHVHNRPRYAFELRAMGYDGQIVCHMHNELAMQRLSAVELDAARREIDFWHFCSDYIRELAVHEQGLPATRCVTIPNGAVPLAARNSSEAHRDGPILCAGRVAPNKGTHLAIEMLGHLHVRGMRKKLVIVGGAGGSGYTKATEYSDFVSRRAKEFNERAGETFVSVEGHQPHERVMDLMAAASLIVLPFQETEPFGMVLVEAMGRSTPVLTIAQGGNAEVIGDGSGGRALDPGCDPSALADAAAGMLDPVTWVELSKGAYDRAHDFTWDQAVRVLEATIEHEIGSPRA